MQWMSVLSNTIIVMPKPHLPHLHAVLINHLLSAAVIRN